MDYNYIRLENQIKALMNQNHVPSSSISKVAEFIKNGSLELYIDTIQKQFVFKNTGINNPISVDPIKNEILNVKLLNGVDISKLIGGIDGGYGINIEEISKGVFKISVIEDTFALKTDIVDVEGKFDNYTTTADLEANYATKTELSNVDSKFNNYTTTIDLEANYLNTTYAESIDEKFTNYPTNKYVDDTFATKSELVDTDSKFNNYTTTTDLEANYLKKTDIIPPSESQFEIVNGYPEYYVKNEHVSTTILPGKNSFSTSEFNVLNITIPSEIKSQMTNIDVLLTYNFFIVMILCICRLVVLFIGGEYYSTYFKFNFSSILILLLPLIIGIKKRYSGL